MFSWVLRTPEPDGLEATSMSRSFGKRSQAAAEDRAVRCTLIPVQGFRFVFTEVNNVVLRVSSTLTQDVLRLSVIPSF